MTGRLATAIHDLHHDEAALAAALLRVAGRHPADPELHHGARDLARWSRQHASDLADAGRRYGVELAARDPLPDPSTDTSAAGGDRSGRDGADPGLLLLADLRDLHRRTAGVVLAWEIVAQAAQALRDRELLALAEASSPQSERQLAWSKALVKSNAAQIMTSPPESS